MFLGKLRIGIGISLITFGMVVGVIAVGGFALYEMQANLMEDRKIKTEHVVEVAESLVAHYQFLEKSGVLTQGEAQEAALGALSSLRYDGAEYFWVQSYDNVILMHATKPALNGQSVAGQKDPNGVRFWDAMISVAKKDGAGFVSYAWNKPGAADPVDKVSFVKAFKPWRWIIGSGIYIDDVQAAFMKNLAIVGMVALIVLLAVGGCALALGRGIANAVVQLCQVMNRLAKKDMAVEIPMRDWRNEIGEMAAAVQVFKDNMIAADRMAEEQKTEQAAREARAKRVEKLCMAFDATSSEAVQTMASEVAEMQSSSESMSATAQETTRQSAAVVAASQQASVNVETVASAAAELSASIGEIGRQVAQASEIASGAVQQAQETNVKVQGLAEAADRIGQVVALITDIADQTNLLALNATIEAARAGEAGKGFAVVASEVKNLANQTAKATDEIGMQIGNIQTATREAVDAIKAIGKTISEIDEVNSGIASAVEEQGAATQEIARNVEEAATGTQEVSSNIDGVSQAANDTGEAAERINVAANDLSQQSNRLRTDVEKFLDNVRAA